MNRIAASWLVLVLLLLLTPHGPKRSRGTLSMWPTATRNGGRRSPSGQPSTSCSPADRHRRVVQEGPLRPAGGNRLRQRSGFGLEQVRAGLGLAWWYRAYAKEQTTADRARYAAAENEARAARRGLWIDINPVPPWEWRRAASHKQSQATIGIVSNA